MRRARTTLALTFAIVAISSLASAKPPRAFPASILGVKWGATEKEIVVAMRRQKQFTADGYDSTYHILTYRGGKLENVRVRSLWLWVEGDNLDMVTVTFDVARSESVIAKTFVQLRKRLVARHGLPTSETTQRGDELLRSEWEFANRDRIKLAVDDDGIVTLTYDHHN